MGTGKPPVHGVLQASDKTKLEFVFNPTDLTVSKASQWKTTPARNAKSAAKSEFTGTGPRGIKMQLVFDSRAHGSPKVEDLVAQLFTWTNPTADSLKQQKPQPPLLVLLWGRNKYFECFLASVTSKYTLFEADGTPMKALVDVVLTETPTSAANQNPTSGGVAGRSTHTIVAGETLHSVAYQEYGRAGHWRALAAVNRIDDPLRVRPGTVLLVPNQTEADALS